MRCASAGAADAVAAVGGDDCGGGAAAGRAAGGVRWCWCHAETQL